MTDVLQLSDLHLLSDHAGTLKGVPTRDALIDVLRYVDEGVQMGRWDFEWVVITGDLAHDEQLATYQMLRELLGDWVSRCRIIPGNHDDRQAIRCVFPELVPTEIPYVNFSVEAAGWRLIGLDSQLPGEVAGHVDAERLAWLAQELTRHSAQPTILFVHHPPFAVHSAWLDRIGLREPGALMELARSSPQVRAISAGHVHQEYEHHLDALTSLTTPSTAVQFRPEEETAIYDPIAPGFRVFILDGDGYDTEVVRLPKLRFPPE